MAFEDSLVMILAGGEGKRLYPLTRDLLADGIELLILLLITS